MQPINTLEHIRTYNKRYVYELIQSNQPISRTSIAQMTDMSPASVTRVVVRLIEKGLVEESVATASLGRGRKAVGLNISKTGAYLVGVYCARTTVYACLIDAADTVLVEVKKEIKPGYALNDLAYTIMVLTLELLRQKQIPKEKLRGVGIGIPGIVSFKDGIVHRSDVLGWADVQVAKPIADMLNCEVSIENDVNACLMGERVKRGLGDDQDAVYLMVDKGLGMAMCANGQLVRGQDNSAGELDRIPVEAGTALQDHLLEKYLIARAKKVDLNISSLQDLKEAYAMRLYWAVWLIDGLRSHLRTVLGMIQGLCAPYALILGGSVIECFQEMLLPDMPANAMISSDFQNNAAYGAAICAQKHSLQALFENEL